ncbi:hypothetical protein C0991_004885 [Blastosporella zonata]|nr:hypothetical protein C0991_004885 [Blastosporella zonata]
MNVHPHADELRRRLEQSVFFKTVNSIDFYRNLDIFREDLCPSPPLIESTQPQEHIVKESDVGAQLIFLVLAILFAGSAIHRLRQGCIRYMRAKGEPEFQVERAPQQEARIQGGAGNTDHREGSPAPSLSIDGVSLPILALVATPGSRDFSPPVGIVSRTGDPVLYNEPSQTLVAPRISRAVVGSPSCGVSDPLTPQDIALQRFPRPEHTTRTTELGDTALVPSPLGLPLAFQDQEPEEGRPTSSTSSHLAYFGELPFSTEDTDSEDGTSPVALLQELHFVHQEQEPKEGHLTSSTSSLLERLPFASQEQELEEPGISPLSCLACFGQLPFSASAGDFKTEQDSLRECLTRMPLVSCLTGLSLVLAADDVDLDEGDASGSYLTEVVVALEDLALLPFANVGLDVYEGGPITLGWDMDLFDAQDGPVALSTPRAQDIHDAAGSTDLEEADPTPSTSSTGYSSSPSSISLLDSGSSTFLIDSEDVNSGEDGPSRSPPSRRQDMLPTPIRRSHGSYRHYLSPPVEYWEHCLIEEDDIDTLTPSSPSLPSPRNRPMDSPTLITQATYRHHGWPPIKYWEHCVVELDEVEVDALKAYVGARGLVDASTMTMTRAESPQAAAGSPSVAVRYIDVGTSMDTTVASTRSLGMSIMEPPNALQIPRGRATTAPAQMTAMGEMSSRGCTRFCSHTSADLKAALAARISKTVELGVASGDDTETRVGAESERVDSDAAEGRDIAWFDIVDTPASTPGTCSRTDESTSSSDPSRARPEGSNASSSVVGSRSPRRCRTPRDETPSPSPSPRGTGTPVEGGASCDTTFASGVGHGFCNGMGRVTG